MSNITSTAATDERFDLGEGVVWDDRAQLVRWVDIREGRVLAGALHGNRISVVDDRAFGHTVGAVALAHDGGMLVAGAQALISVSPDGASHPGPNLLPKRTDSWRLNDGIVDPQGRYLIGTLCLDDSLAHRQREEVLLRVSPDGKVETLRTGLGLANGLGFSPDGAVLFHIDTFAKQVVSHSYGPGEFDTEEPWTVVIDGTSTAGAQTGFPDGMTVDAAGDLWVAFWGGARIARFSPDGQFHDEIRVNAAQPTCPAFVGPDLSSLAITTASKGLESPKDDSGAVFVAHPLTAGEKAVRGKLEYRWSGSTTEPNWPDHRVEEH